MTDSDKITPADLESKFREIQGQVDAVAEDSKQKAIPVAVGAGLLLVVLVYLLGKRSGKRKSTVVQIRRL